MFSTARSLSLTRSVAGRRLFHASAPALVKVGDKLPDVDLVEGSPGNKVNLAKELTGKGVIIGVLHVLVHLDQHSLTTLKGFLLPSRLHVQRITSPAMSTLLNSKMLAKSLWSP